MATTSKNTAAAEVAEDEVTVPKQAEKANVTAIKKNEEPDFYGDDVEASDIVSRVKRLVKNRKVVAGVVTTSILTVAVLVIRKRNSAEQEAEETPAEA